MRWLAALGCLAAWGLGTGCATALPPLQGELLDVGHLERPTADNYPNADGVTLLREVRGRLDGGKEQRSRWLHHEAIAILTEDGLARADHKIFVPKKAEIVSLRGRTITADGQVHWLDPSRVHDDEGKGSKEDTEYSTKIFTFPQASVGSVLEVEYVIEFPWLPDLYSQTISGELPIKKFRVEVAGTDNIYYRVMSYNVAGATPWAVDEDGSNWALRWGLDDVPKKKSPSYAGHSDNREPRWAFSVQAIERHGTVIHVNSSWDNAVQHRGAQMYHDNEEYYAGFAAKPDVSACGPRDVKCKVAAAQEWLTKALPMRGFRGWPGRKAKQVWASQSASDVEKSRLLYRVLQNLGVEARFALFHPYLDGHLDPDFPQLLSLRRVALVVRKTDGLDEDLWLDPACEYCKPGVLPHWLEQTDALVVDYAFDKLVTTPKYTGVLQKVQGRLATMPPYVREYRVQVDEDGRGRVEARNQYGGYDAQLAGQRLRQRKAEDWQKTAEEFVEERFSQGTLVGQEPPSLDPATRTGRRIMHIEAPGIGLQDQGTLVVPLSFFHWSFDKRFKAKKRSVPIVLRYPFDLEEVAIIEVPEGWTVKTLPEAAQRRGIFHVEVSATGTGRKVEVRRTLKATRGVHPVARYAEARAALNLFRSLRDKAITFERQALSQQP